MLKEANIMATLAVKDLSAGKKFYGETLGLNQANENPGGVAYKCGEGTLFVYQSETAGTGQATCASWQVADIEAAVDELKQKGISFEHYDMPKAEVRGDIYVYGPMKSAWFKDPDGNILNLNASS
jgi:catechol 2,3-dioxygenase-like lactoylglutathione lyase family enzyme